MKYPQDRIDAYRLLDIKVSVDDKFKYFYVHGMEYEKKAHGIDS